MANIIRGDDSPQLQKQTYGYDAQRGGTYTEDWKGFNPNKMIVKYNGLVYTSQRTELTIAQGVATMRIEWGGSTGGQGAASSIEITIDRWECPEPKADKDLFTHSGFLQALAAGGGLNYQQLSNMVSAVRRFAENAKSAGQSINNENDLLNILAAYVNGLGLSMPANNEPWLYFYRMYINGQDRYQYSQYGIRHTTNAPSYWSRNVSDVNVNAIYTQAQFLSECTNSSLWYFPLPGRLQYKMAAAYADFISKVPVPGTLLGAFQNGWLKSASSEVTVGRGRTEIQTGFVLDQWSTSVYPLAT